MQSTGVISEVGKRLAREVPPRSRVVLFGSRARGEAGEDSDFDLLVIEPSITDPMSESVRLGRALGGLGVPTDVIVVDRREAEVGCGCGCVAR